jgi:hypothetical protein
MAEVAIPPAKAKACPEASVQVAEMMWQTRFLIAGGICGYRVAAA